MKINFKIYFVLLLLSCNPTGEEETQILVHYEGNDLVLKRSFYRDGTIKAERTFLDLGDTLIPHGYGKLFFENGILEYFANYQKGIKTGAVKRYFRSGQIREAWFYNPLGQALYMTKYDSIGNLIHEEGRQQRKPQIVVEENKNLVVLEVFSADIPKHYKNIYLFSPDGEVLDSCSNCKMNAEIFKVKKITRGLYKIKVEYYQNFLEQIDSISFKINQ